MYISNVITNITWHSCEKNYLLFTQVRDRRKKYIRKREREKKIYVASEGREREGEGEKESKSSWLVPEKTLRAAGCRRSIMKIPVYLLLHVDPSLNRLLNPIMDREM